MYDDYHRTKYLVTKSDKSQNLISTVTVTVESGIEESTKSQNPIVTKSDGACILEIS